jgi:transcriptional regulator with GAF, ATPase, and Fis domain
VELSDSLTELVCKQRHAIWIAKQRGKTESDSLDHYADALCVPLVSDHATLGAVHAYLDQGRFRQSDFDFAISLANILVIALIRARQQSSLETDYRRLIAKSSAFGELIGESAGMRELKSKISRVARASGCVLLRGESGSGKELVARAIHKASPRADRPMLCVNCAAIPHELMESQLFGHKAGAFTSADRDHMGFFQQADSGTLFLDEVGEMTLEGQAKLLRILEGHPFMPVGSSTQVSQIRKRFSTDWGLSETGATGPTGNRYGDAAGHSCMAVAGPAHAVFTLETGSADRQANMVRFAATALDLLLQNLGK